MRRKSARSLIVRALLLLSQLVRAGDACGLDFLRPSPSFLLAIISLGTLRCVGKSARSLMVRALSLRSGRAMPAGLILREGVLVAVVVMVDMIVPLMLLLEVGFRWGRRGGCESWEPKAMTWYMGEKYRCSELRRK